MEFTTLNQVIETIKDQCNNHAQINSVYFGQDQEIDTDNVLYPSVWIYVQPSRIDTKTFYLVISILVVDRQELDEKNKQDVLSDTLSIAQDIYAMLANPEFASTLNIEYQVNLSPETEILPNMVNGWRMDLTFDLESTRDRCQIPLKDFLIDEFNNIIVTEQDENILI